MLPSFAPHYPRCRAWLLKALETDANGSSEDDLLNDLMHGRAQLWPGRSAAMVTRLMNQTRGGMIVPTMVVWLAGGDLEGVLELQPGMLAWARAQGAVEVAIYARKGWSRVLAKHGFKVADGELRLAL